MLIYLHILFVSQPWMLFFNALILENAFCMDLPLFLCLFAFVHCGGPQAS